MSIVIKAEGICGTSIDELAYDCIELSKKLDVQVTSNFNGVDFSVYKNSTVEGTKNIILFYLDLKRKEDEKRRKDNNRINWFSRLLNRFSKR